jgi:HlyD family secretion protein
MTRRILLIAVLLMVAIGGAVVWYSPLFKSKTDTGVVFASGTIDATEVAISFRLPRILLERTVDEGSRVRAGEILARLDAREAFARLGDPRSAIAS